MWRFSFLFVYILLCVVLRMLRGAPGEAARAWGAVGGNHEPSTSRFPDPIRKVAIFGHSYVRDLPLEEPLQRPAYYVRQFCLPGGKVATIKEKPVWEKLLSYKPDLTFVILGGNDISRTCDVHHLALALQDLVKEIEDRTGGYCYVVSIESRTHPRGMTPEDYNKCKNGLNARLRRNFKYTAHKRYLAMGMSKSDLWDGVHLGTTACSNLLERILDKADAYFMKLDDREAVPPRK